MSEVLQVAHVPGDHEQDGCQGSEWNTRCERRQEQKHRDQGGRMNHARQRTCPSVSNVRGGAGDGPCRCEASKQRRQQVGDSLADQLLVGVVLVARHPVGDDGREKGFDGAQHGDGERRSDQRDGFRDRQIGQRESRQAKRNPTECAAKRCDALEVKGRLQDGGDHHGRQGAGKPFETLDARRAQDQQQAQRRQRDGGQMHLRHHLHQLP